MKKTTRRVILMSPAALGAAQNVSTTATEEQQKARAAMDAARTALRKVTLKRETEPAFSFKA
jgi:hypothetical protein